ncbi:hypothetical protein J6590_066516 [Homalodisca vitripennis]|nr:hypothetical protein J6590_066516 [Homalodisca vitripennis]
MVAIDLMLLIDKEVLTGSSLVLDLVYILMKLPHVRYYPTEYSPCSSGVYWQRQSNMNTDHMLRRALRSAQGQSVRGRRVRPPLDSRRDAHERPLAFICHFTILYTVSDSQHSSPLFDLCELLLAHILNSSMIGWCVV